MIQPLAKMVIFQNYFTPYRHKLFTEIAKQIELTVIYLQEPQEEGRVWTEQQYAAGKNYVSAQLQNKRLSRISPFNKIVWVTGLHRIKALAQKGTKVVFLDNLPTNFTMLRIVGKLKHIPRQDRILWNEHIIPHDGDSWLKNTYRKFMTVLLAIHVNTVLSFSAMTTEYLTSLGIPMTGQKVVRTIQAVYTGKEIEELKIKVSKVNDIKGQKILTFGFMGYFSERKGLREFLTAIKYYKNPKAQFVFAGTGPMEDDLKRAALQDPRIITYPKYFTEDEKTRNLLEMTVHVVPSYKDPWVLVVNEAASRGVPSIVSPNVGAKELIQKIDPTFVLEDNRAITLAKAFTEIAQRFANKKEWGGIREKTFEFAGKWSIEAAAEAFVGISKTTR
jgi:glycosyltransferase involved in cell wall biosynthesis